MKVFVSSTCYDLLDLRAELHEDLRDLGVDALFSELKESNFETRGDPTVNSIETCLENLRGSDVVVVVLSERYGGLLKRGYGDISATHVEYREAQKAKKRILFYVRDRLFADWSTWKKQGRPAGYVPTWAASPEDATGLFNLIHEHQKLVGGTDDPGTNNWYWQFSTSLDLRADLRKRLEADAFRATGEKLIRQGQVPILLIVGAGVLPFAEDKPPERRYFRFQFQLVNAGPVPAMSVQGDLLYGDQLLAGGNDARAGVVLPGTTASPTTVSFDLRQSVIRALFGEETPEESLPVLLNVHLGYSLPSGHTMRDHFQVNLVRRASDIQLYRLPDYGGKSIIGMQSYVLAD